MNPMSGLGGCTKISPPLGFDPTASRYTDRYTGPPQSDTNMNRMNTVRCFNTLILYFKNCLWPFATSLTSE